MNLRSCQEILDSLIERWNVLPVGAPILTHASCLLAGERDGRPVMLKTSQQPDEIRGFALLAWWNGNGAIRVLEHEPDAILMERATDSVSLVGMSDFGEDEQAVAIICHVLDQLHHAGMGEPPPLVVLQAWFAPLIDWVGREPFMERGRHIAIDLLRMPQDPILLHGDMHHDNIVRTADGVWRAIDPQGLFGSRAFDYANIFRNPNLTVAADPIRFRARLDQVSRTAAIERRILVGWIIALCALSYSWGDHERLPANTDRIIAELALMHMDE